MGRSLKQALVYGAKIPITDEIRVKVDEEDGGSDLPWDYPSCGSGLEIEYSGWMEYEPAPYLVIEGAGTHAYDGEPLEVPIYNVLNPEWDQKIRDALDCLEWIDDDGNPVPRPEVKIGWFLICSFG